jgi:hypothetical protein
MGKKTHRGKAGGRRRFLRGLQRELNSTKDFDPSAYWAPESPLPTPTEDSHTAKYICPPRDILKEIKEFRMRAARASSNFVPTRKPTFPVRPTIYSRTPSSTRRAPSIISNHKTNFWVQRTPTGYCLIHF